MTDIEPARRPVALGNKQDDFDAAYRLAKNLSVSSLLPQALRNKPADVLVTILYGQELGLAPMQAMNAIYVVNGRPTISGQLWAALARKAGHKVRVTDETAESCTVEVERHDDPGHPTRVTYTIAQAKQAGLAGKDVWKQHPAAMLYARAVSTACRRACPEVALGFGDETDVPAQPERPTLAQVAAQRDDKDIVAASTPGRINGVVDTPAPADDEEMAEIVNQIEAEHGAAAAQEAEQALFADAQRAGEQ